MRAGRPASERIDAMELNPRQRRALEAICDTLLPRERREAVLRSWCDSRVGPRRAAFTALRKAALLFGYMVPGPDGAPNPRWEACAYPGPLGPPADPPPKALAPLRVDADTRLECDVVVCGSGAGGGTAAAVL